MLSNEMRIGNIFEHKNKTNIVQITAFNIVEQYQCDMSNKECFIPAKITENFLLKIGFRNVYKSELQKQFEKDSFENKSIVSVKHKLKTNAFYFSFSGLIKEIKFMHELQNLYYELKKEKLDI